MVSSFFIYCIISDDLTDADNPYKSKNLLPDYLIIFDKHNRTFD